MTTTELRRVDCQNHPGRPASTLRPDGSLRCEECVQEPRVVGWSQAAGDFACWGCRIPIGAGGRLAVLDTVPTTTVCEGCVE